MTQTAEAPIDAPEFHALGQQVRDLARKLDTFPTPEHLDTVTYVTDEVTAICPVTGQPDWYTVAITMMPDELCIESKSLKLYLQTFREEGHFCEQFANLILEDVRAQLQPYKIEVEVTQKPRGGIAIVAKAQWDRENA